MLWFFLREACWISAPQPGIEVAFWEACWISAPQPGIELASSALEGEVLATGPPRKSPVWILHINKAQSYT